MKLKQNLIAGAALALCSAASFAATPPAICSATAIATASDAEAFVGSCAPEARLFIGGASTMSGNVQAIALAQVFDTTTFTPIVISDKGSASGIAGNVKAYYGRAKAGLGTLAGKRLLVVYNYNNGSAGGVSQLAKTPKMADQADPLKAIPEADVVFVGPAKTQTEIGGTANAFCGTAASGVTSTATLVGCTSHTTQPIDVALSDVRAQELYKLYPAAAKLKASDLTQVPLFLQSFGVAVSDKLYKALQAQQGLTVGDFTAANQPSISSAVYASLVSKGGTINSLATLTGDTALTDVLKLARRDDYSGTQAASNIFFVNGQCGGNGNKDVAKSLDQKVFKAGGLMGGLAIRDTTDSAAGVLEVQANVTSGNVRTVVGSTTDYAIGVAGVGSGGLQGTAGRFVKIDGISPNFDGTNYLNATATRNQIASGNYPFAYTLHAMYVTKTMDKLTDQKAMVLAMIDGFKNSNLSNLSGIAYLDGGVAAQQTKVNRAGNNNCSPIVFN